MVSAGLHGEFDGLGLEIARQFETEAKIGIAI
jgi:hypothetical protein